MGDMDNLIKEFLEESRENLDQLDSDLVALEKDPGDGRTLGSIFRTIHTLKGTCGFLGFSRLEQLAHVGENLLGRLRTGLLLLRPEIATALLAMVDAIRAMLADIEALQKEGEADYSDLAATLKRLNEAPSAIDGAGPAPAVGPPPSDVRQHLVEQGLAKTMEVLSAVREQQEAASPPSEGNIRVDVGLLDKLMNLVGELVLARNQVLQVAATQKDATFLSTTQRLNLITTELQESVMKTRMQPIGNIWNRFPRVVRDLAVVCGKQVRIEMEGQETELDKTIIEAITGPLTHIVRNAVDHGIEPPAVRSAAGKPLEGCLSLRAFHEGGQVNIEISDDGGGIDADKIKAGALERGLITRDQAARMHDRELIQLIFLPGFSTAERVTNVSGRGVGMDVVKTNVENIGGIVDIHSHPGRGTTLKIKIPLTLAIIPALTVTSGGERYAIPQVSLLELVRLEREQAQRSIEHIHGAPVYRLRGRLLPLVDLERELGGVGPSSGDAVNIVVLQADERQFGLVVEGINDTEEIVVKPMGKQLKGITVFAGATIMGDGRVALILDVMGIAQRAGVVAAVRHRSRADVAARSVERRADRKALLLFGLGDQRRLAIPLSMVARLEEIAASGVEHANGREVVQYRGRILPLVRLAALLGATSKPASTLQVIVYTEEERSVGLVVDRILDIVETNLEVQHCTGGAGFLGSAIIQEAVTELLDLPALMRTAGPGLMGALAI